MYMYAEIVRNRAVPAVDTHAQAHEPEAGLCSRSAFTSRSQPIIIWQTGKMGAAFLAAAEFVPDVWWPRPAAPEP